MPVSVAYSVYRCVSLECGAKVGVICVQKVPPMMAPRGPRTVGGHDNGVPRVTVPFVGFTTVTVTPIWAPPFTDNVDGVADHSSTAVGSTGGVATEGDGVPTDDGVLGRVTLEAAGATLTAVVLVIGA